MAEPPPEPPTSKLKGCLTLMVFFVTFFIIGPCIMWGGLTEFFFPYKERQLKMVLADARVTAISENRRQYTYYLDDNETEAYNFNGYVSVNPALRKQVDDSIGLDPFDLGHYLRLQDRLTKAANSPLLTVQRGPVVTHWILYAATPAAKLPLQKKYIVIVGDTVIEHELSELI
jgi:hypothetical protein